MPRFIITAVALTLSLVFACTASAQMPKRYRDLQLYTTSRPSEQARGDASKIVATMRFVNRGDTPLKLRATLAANRDAGFAGGEFKASVPANGESAWTFELQPVEGFKRTILSGQIAFVDADGKEIIDRDLYVAVQGRDETALLEEMNKPEASARGEYKLPRELEPIEESARVVATYAPRTLESIQTNAAATAAAQPKPTLTVAASNASDYIIAVPALAPIAPTQALSPASEGTAAAPDPDAWRKNTRFTQEQADLLQAVDDLRRIIHVQSGAKLAIEPESPKAGQKAIVISVAAPTFATTLKHPNAYHTFIDPDLNVHIESMTIDGLTIGVYGFATDHLNARWYQPGTLGEEIPVPADRAVKLPAIDTISTPSWFSSNGMSWGNQPLWDWRNRSLIRRGKMNFGHSWHGYVNPSEYPYDTFPDMYARDREGRIRKKDESWTSTNFCSTSPQVIEIVAKKVNERLKADPNSVVISLDPNDYAPMCLCDRCLSLDKQYGQKREDGVEVSDRLIHFSNEIYARLEPSNRSRFLGILIYGYQMELPLGAKPHDHYAGTICNFPPRYDHSRPWNDPTSERNRDFLRLVKGWGSLLKQLGYYDYYGHWYFFAPFGVIHKMREDFPAFKEYGGTFLVTEAQPNFACNGVNHYIASKLAWNIDTDVDLALEDFFTGYYGPAANAMRGYWLAAERHYALERPGTSTERKVGWRDEFWRELEANLTLANAAVAHPDVSKRYKDRVQFTRDGFDFGKAAWDFDRIFNKRRGGIGGAPEDAVRMLQARKPQVEALKARYPAGDPYWPTFLPAYFWPDVDALIKQWDEKVAAEKK